MGKVASFICGLAAVILGFVGSAVAAESDNFRDYVSELRFGILDHDPGLFGGDKESGIDINFEALFHSPEAFKYILSPRPHLGVSINTVGDTSKAYFGLSWGLDIGPVFIEGTFGGAAHNGETDINPDRDKKELGCTLNFRESASIGYRFLEHHSLSIMVDHISNAGLCSENEGMETFGLRYGYTF
jgi:lipid A 3-O-deacylase